LASPTTVKPSQEPCAFGTCVCIFLHPSYPYLEVGGFVTIHHVHNLNAPGPSRTPIPINQTTPSIVPITENVTEDLSFLNEFANTDLSVFEEEMMENTGSPMNAGNAEL
jgi:hypothetical protein